ncbi:MAG TPA: hypothetical protein DGQ94_04480 [Pseudomonas sp.]|nr:hypothetical protein [Pseudomonas sp.]
MGAGVPAKQAPRWMARASPVFAGAPAPTAFVQCLDKKDPRRQGRSGSNRPGPLQCQIFSAWPSARSAASCTASPSVG